MGQQSQQDRGRNQDCSNIEQDDYQHIEREDFQNLEQEQDRGYQNIEQGESILRLYCTYFLQLYCFKLLNRIAIIYTNILV